MEARTIVGLIIGVFIYTAAVSGLYLVFKDDIAYQREQIRKARAKRKKAKELAQIAKTMKSTIQTEKEDEISKDTSSEEEK